jgi:glycyl-tRNA synthetase
LHLAFLFLEKLVKIKAMADLMAKIVSLAKRRGFIFPSSEIYGGFGSGYDFGPLGVEMKNNIKRAWWDEMTKKQEGIVGLDAAILMSPRVWQASGHLTAGFADELVECKKCHKRFRIDEVKGKCPDCGGEITKPRKFNLMMKTFIGPVEDKASVTYLRAETCQGIYVNFNNIVNSMRLKLPFGVAQIGKAFRNEITPGNFIYRTREFEQMEMQYFVASPQSKIKNQKSKIKNTNQKSKIKTPDDWFNYWVGQRVNWYLKLGIKKENLRTREVPKSELAHYAKRAVDIEYKFPFGWKEIEGIHNRGDWDLSNHSKCSREDLTYEGYYPYVIETSGGADRSFLAFLVSAYQEVKGGRTKTTEAKKEVEVVLKLHKKLAPIKVAVLPLVKNKPELVKKAKEIYKLLKPHFTVQYDEVGSIGRRYRRVDEIGTPFAITIDFDTLKKKDVTLRDRDTMSQKRVKIKDLIKILKEKLDV